MMQATPQPGAKSARAGKRQLPAESQRSCVVCRCTRAPHELVALQVVGDRLALGHRLRGRGAWVCLSRACLEQLTSRHAARAFRQAVSAPDTLLAEGHALAERKVFELIGLARRQGALALGIERIEAAPVGALVLLAADLSERSRRHAGARAHVFADAGALGRACGAGRVGALAITPGPLEKQAAYWLQLWYETAPIGQNEVDDG